VRANYAARLEAIGGRKATSTSKTTAVKDETGQMFADALVAKVREGVRVRLIYDWMGGFGKTSCAFWNHLHAGGVEVRCYSPPQQRRASSGWRRGLERRGERPGATAGVFRLDQLVAALTRMCLWLTDPCYTQTTAYLQTLGAAAKDSADARLLLPNVTDILILRPLSRARYRPSLETGVRVFEWNGTMLPAKAAVADGCWVPVGSTSLTMASWLCNCELDVVVEPAMTSGGGSAGRAAAGAIRIGNAVGAAFTNRLVLGPVKARLMTSAGA
jgi:phosphatidylserine/phosphatidylglycerophosphate/cardiolipin synthase-like enzyme